MSDMDALIEAAGRAGCVLLDLDWDDLDPTDRAEAESYHRTVLEAVGLPALLERVEAAEALLRAVEDSRHDPSRAIIKADRLAGEAIIKADALAAKVADTGERIALAIEAQRVCCQDSYCSTMHQRTIDAAIARRGDV